MALSNSFNFTINMTEIIEQAYDACGLLDAGQALDSESTTLAAKKLNMMISTWPRGYLWGIQEATLFLAEGTASYSLGPTGTHCTTSYVKTTLSAAAASGATTISLTSTTGMTAADNIGIVLDSGVIHWTTITTVATTLIASGLASAAASGNVVFAYTSKIQRPNRIVPDTVYYRNKDDSDIPMTLISREEYMRHTKKTDEGKPIELWYEPLLTNGTARIWPAPNLATDVVRFSFERNLADFDVGGDEPDFPIEWAEPLVLGLAARIAISLAPEKLVVIKALAQAALTIALGYDKENSSVYFQPDLR